MIVYSLWLDIVIIYNLLQQRFTQVWVLVTIFYPVPLCFPSLKHYVRDQSFFIPHWFFLMASQPTMVVWLPTRIFPSASHASWWLYLRYWPWFVCFPQDLLVPAWKVSSDKSLGAGLSRKKNWPHPSKIQTQAHTDSTAHLDFPEACCYLWRDLPCKSRTWSCILSLRLRGRMIS